MLTNRSSQQDNNHLHRHKNDYSRSNGSLLYNCKSLNCLFHSNIKFTYSLWTISHKPIKLGSRNSHLHIRIHCSEHFLLQMKYSCSLLYIYQNPKHNLQCISRYYCLFIFRLSVELSNNPVCTTNPKNSK